MAEASLAIGFASVSTITRSFVSVGCLHSRVSSNCRRNFSQVNNKSECGIAGGVQ